MEIDIRQLPPWAQEQIAEKILKQERERSARKKDPSTPLRSAQNDTGNGRKHAGDHGEKENKYHNIPDIRNGAECKIIKFKSKKEARRYDELMLMRKAGTIRDLKLQPQFTLQESYVTPEGKRVRAIRYVADFSYSVMPPYWKNYEEQCPDDAWYQVVEDVKGGRATKTREYAIKKKLLQERFGISITEIE